ncbi:hypothetical protein Taro_047414 [Colocasia esculenta]|uniref:SRR1-like domain-containing protein n=1 Tax=Colocasia esculenta TaxID=4460 RepID=A0A843WVB3_COLES|nr:hypothetical protein [Colocasia esculenta]
MAARTAAIPAADPNPTSDLAGSWTVVLPRRRRRGVGGGGVNYRRIDAVPSPHPAVPPAVNLPLEPLPWSPSDGDDDPVRVARLLHKMRSAVAKLEGSPFRRRFLAQLRDDPQIRSNFARVAPSTEKVRIVVYGIGSIESYEPPRLQLALAMLLGRELDEAAADAVEVFDPVLSAAECAVVEALGCRVARVDEGGRRVVDRPTLFYMPHCEAVLYDNLLATNWGRPSALRKMVVLGNSFSEYGKYVEEGLGGRGSVRVAEKARFLLEARGFMEEIKVENVGLEEGEESLIRAFNETSWHFFCLDADATGAQQLEAVSGLHPRRAEYMTSQSQAHPLFKRKRPIKPTSGKPIRSWPIGPGRSGAR